jgi:hypothetical protein
MSFNIGDRIYHIIRQEYGIILEVSPTGPSDGSYWVDFGTSNGLCREKYLILSNFKGNPEWIKIWESQ